jgi:hypothetical protein
MVTLDNTQITPSSAVFKNGTNGSSGNVLNSEWFVWNDHGTYSSSSVKVNGSGATYYSNIMINATYTYGEATTPSAGIGALVTNIDDFPGWFAVIVVVLCAALIVGVVIRSFGQR